VILNQEKREKTMTEATSNQTPVPAAGHRRREPLPVKLGTATPTTPAEPKPVENQLGPDDLRLEFKLKITGHGKVLADERVCADLPGALTPPARGALHDAIAKSFAWTVQSATIKVNHEIHEPPYASFERGARAPGARTDEYPVAGPPPQEKANPAAGGMPPSYHATDYPDVLSQPPSKKQGV
jgi:hypothetical protein